MLESNYLMISSQTLNQPPLQLSTPRRSLNQTPQRVLHHNFEATQQTVKPQQNPDSNCLILYTPDIWNVQLQDVCFEKRSQEIYPILFSMDKGSVTGGMRALLYNWMIIVVSDHQFTRDTYALSTSLMDMYFCKKPSIPKDQLQILGFAAVSLASKIQENKNVLNLGTLFQKADILKFQQTIMKTLDFRLNPDTHIHWAKLLMSSWDIYRENGNPKYKTCIFMSKNQIAFTLSREFFELSDGINLHDKSGKWDKQQWSKNLFYILIRKQAQGMGFPSNLQKFLMEFYKYDDVLLYFCDFILSIGLSAFHPNKEIGKFIFGFLSIEINYDTSDFQTSCWSQYISIQTFNKSMYNYVVKILKSD